MPFHKFVMGNVSVYSQRRRRRKGALGNVEAGGSPVCSPTARWGPHSTVAHIVWHHVWEEEDKSSFIFLTVKNSSVCNSCSGLLCLVSVVYSNVVNYKMDPGPIHESRIKWKTRHGRLWSVGRFSSCRRTWQSQHSPEYSPIVFSNRSHTSPDHA